MVEIEAADSESGRPGEIGVRRGEHALALLRAQFTVRVGKSAQRLAPLPAGPQRLAAKRRGRRNGPALRGRSLDLAVASETSEPIHDMNQQHGASGADLARVWLGERGRSPTGRGPEEPGSRRAPRFRYSL